MDEERWQESLNARNTLAANQAIYAAWSAAWTAEATDYTTNMGAGGRALLLFVNESCTLVQAQPM